MANRFSSRDVIGEHTARFGNMALQLYGMKQQGDIAAHQALTDKEKLMQGRETLELAKTESAARWGSPERIEAPAMEGGEPRVTPGTEGLEQRKMKVLEQTAEDEKKKNADIQNFEPWKAAPVVERLQELGLSKEYPLIKKIKELAWNAKITNYDAYQEIKSLYPQFREEMGDKVMADFVRKSKDNSLYENSPEGQAQQQFVMALARDDTGDSILGAAFADTIAAAQRRQGPAMKAEGFKGLTVQDPNSPTGWSHLDPNQGVVIRGAPPPASARAEKVPSAGNQADLAVMRKFGDPTYLTDPTKAAEAAKWLGTEEGRKFTRDAAQDVIAPTMTFLQTAEGFVPVSTRGPTAGTPGKPLELAKPLPAEAAGKIGEIEAVLQNLQTVKQLYKPEWVGPVAGRIGGLKEKYTGGATPEQVSFYAYVRDMQDALLRARSGAQINEQEYKRLVAFLPEPNLPPQTFVPRLERFEQSLNVILEQKKKALGEAGYGVKTTPTTKAKKIGRFTVEVE